MNIEISFEKCSIGIFQHELYIDGYFYERVSIKDGIITFYRSTLFNYVAFFYDYWKYNKAHVIDIPTIEKVLQDYPIDPDTVYTVDTFKKIMTKFYLLGHIHYAGYEELKC